MKNLHRLLTQKLDRTITEEEMEEFREAVRKDTEKKGCPNCGNEYYTYWENRESYYCHVCFAWFKK